MKTQINLKNYENLDYEKLNFKAGLEIHQQLNTKKLFCSCPSNSSDDYDFEVRRKLHISQSETGEIDLAAQYERKKEKTFIYRGKSTEVCLVELDEEPPHEINQEALKITLQASKLLNCKIVDEIQVMRKIVVDGSNTTGFQRTMLVSYDGNIDGVTIATICLEEDACKIIEKKENEVIYHLNRLGIPLIEIATNPEIKNPEHLKEVAKKIGLTLRSLNVKRGLGTIRQDLNISILNNNRVEIKGAQDLKNLHIIAKYEVIRQLRLLELKEYLNKTLSKEEIKFEIIDLTQALVKTKNKILQSAINSNQKIKGMKFPKMINVFGFELLPDLRFGTELAGIAKLFGLKGLFHRDELIQLKYGFTKEDLEVIEKELNISELDNYILIAGTEEQLKNAFEMIYQRVLLAFDGIPKEVRKVNENFTTSFLRPMPGSERMYPETDVPVIKPFPVEIPKSIFEKIKEYEALGLSKDVAEQIASDCSYFDELIKFKIKPTTIATFLLSIDKDLEEIKENVIYALKTISDNNLPTQLLNEITSYIDNKEKIQEKFSQILNQNPEKLKQEIIEKIRDCKKNNFNLGKTTSLIMNEYKTKYNPQELLKLIQEEFSK
ncbi:MAG: Glu-tRNA(Gln) amidotransferase subunit GatE [Candidatus Woesearchaeota archaeon]